MNERVVNIPEQLILDKELGEMRALMYASIIFTHWDDSRPIRELIEFSGFVPKSGENGTTEKFKQCKDTLVTAGYFGSNYSPFSFHSNSVVYFDEFKKIADYKRTKSCRISIDRCFLLLAFLRGQIREKVYMGNYYAEQISKIADIIGLEVKYVPKYIDILQELGLIYSEKVPRLVDNCGQWYTSLRFFVEATSRTNPNYDPRTALEKAKHNFINRW